MPKREELETLILWALNELGGEAPTKEVYQRVAAFFPQLSQEELNRRVKSGDKVWANRIRWAKLALVQKGEVISSKRGVWCLTEKGKERAKNL